MSSESIRTTVVLPRDLLEAVDELTTPRTRSAFVAEAVRHKVDQARRQRILRETAGILKDESIPGWDTPDETSAWVREQRRLDEERFSNRTGTDDERS